MADSAMEPQDRVAALVRDWNAGNLNDREFRAIVHTLNADELNHLADLLMQASNQLAQPEQA